MRSNNRKLNPLWIISLFLTFTETMLGYAVFNTEGEIQITLTLFVVAFPLLVATIFFIFLWYRPENLYAPSDYLKDESFIESLKRDHHAENLNSQIEEVVKNQLNSTEIINQLKSDKPEVVLRETAKKIVSKIDENSFIKVDLKNFNSDFGDNVTWPYDSFKDFNDLTNAVYFKIRSEIRPYTYGKSWIMKNVKSNLEIQNLRMLLGKKDGRRIKDDRHLKDVGITPGMELIVEKINEGN